MKFGRYSLMIFPAVLGAGMTVLMSDCRSTRLPAVYKTDTIYTNARAAGDLLQISFKRGAGHNHPLMAFWVTDTMGRYIQTLYVAQ